MTELFVQKTFLKKNDQLVLIVYLFESVEYFGLPGIGMNSHLTKKKKVFVTEGKDVALTGVCISFIRSSFSKPVTTENIYQVSQ